MRREAMVVGESLSDEVLISREWHPRRRLQGDPEVEAFSWRQEVGGRPV